MQSTAPTLPKGRETTCPFVNYIKRYLIKLLNYYKSICRCTHVNHLLHASIPLCFNAPRFVGLYLRVRGYFKLTRSCLDFNSTRSSHAHQNLLLAISAGYEVKDMTQSNLRIWERVRKVSLLAKIGVYQTTYSL